jgi:methyl-accepting chemotaxis protein
MFESAKDSVIGDDMRSNTRKVVQSNAASAEEFASASEGLSSQAQELNSMVAELTRIVEGAVS